jgi:large subunit ribosomal protein L22
MTPDETPEETPETEAEEPRRRPRRRRGASGEAPAAGSSRSAHGSEAPRPDSEAESEAEVTRGASDADAAPEIEEAGVDADEVEETPEDVLAEEAASDVMLEADAEAEGEAEGETEEEAEAEAEALGDLEQEAPAPAPAPSRRRRGERGARRDVVVRAQAKYVRSSARKARLVCDHIRGKSVDEARAILAHTSRAVARDWSKLLESAVANAENNHELVGEDLYVKEVHADEGPTIRRFRPRAMGRATRIRKRTSHLTILLTPKD